MNEQTAADVQFRDDEMPVDAWRIDDLSTADWALKRIQELQMETEEITAVELQRIAEINARAKKLRERAERGIAFFEAKLREFAETHRDLLLKGGKQKTRNLIHGSIGWKKKPGTPRVADENTLLTWAIRQPPEKGFLRVIEEPAWDVIKQHVKLTGEVPPGVEVTEDEERFVVKAGGNEK